MLTSHCLCTRLRRASRAVSHRYDEALADLGLNVAQYSLLRHIERLDRPSITGLAEATGLDRSTLGRNLKVLEGAGLVTLGEGADLRHRLVALSETGRQRLAQALPRWRTAQARVAERLGEDHDTLMRLLATLERLD